MLRILFVEDNPDDVLLAGNVLRRAGLAFEERVAGSLDDVPAAFDAGPWDIVISDYNLGTHTGLDVLHLVRSIDADVPFVLLSGTIGEERAVEAIREGAADYVMKDRMVRLPAAVRRELEAVESRRERSALEARLRGAEERYRRTFEEAPVGIAYADRSGILLSANTRFCELVGYAEHEVIGHQFADFGYPEDHAVGAANAIAVATGERATARYDRRYYRRDGRVAWGSVSLAGVRGANGEVEYVIGLVEDITEQKAAEADLRERERELRRRAGQQSAIARLGTRVLTSFDAAVLDEACELLRLETGAEFTFIERAQAHVEHGFRIPVSSAARVFGILAAESVQAGDFGPEDADFIQTVANILAEAMERQFSQEERERLTRSLELLLESTVEGIYTVDVDGRCTMINRAAAAFLGLTPDEILGSSMHDLMHRNADGSIAPVEQSDVYAVLRNGHVHTSAADRFARKDGVLIPVSYSAAPIIDAGVIVGAVVTFTDLTEKSKLEAKLEQVTRLSSLGRLAATVAHEFNNVLMGISPFVEAVRRAPSPQHAAGSLDHIAASVKRGRRITEDILRFTQPAQPVRTSVEVDAWLQGIAVEARSLVGRRHEVIVRAEPLFIDADPNQLHQVFTNLILNSRDAMPGGGTITLTARREAPDARFPFGTVNDPSRFAHLIASDTGSGMTEEILRHVFEPLFTTKKNGTGLGLPVAHQVVQRHGGEIFIESAPRAGTAFHIFLPLSTPETAPVNEPTDERHHEVAPTRHILLVEDDPLVAAGLREMLEYEKFDVTAVNTGGDALDAVRRTVPDAVILDVGLPDIDGTAVMVQMLAAHPHLPILFSTGHADRGKLEELLTAPNVGFLLKPYAGDALMKALAEVMGT